MRFSPALSGHTNNVSVTPTHFSTPSSPLSICSPSRAHNSFRCCKSILAPRATLDKTRPDPLHDPYPRIPPRQPHTPAPPIHSVHTPLRDMHSTQTFSMSCPPLQFLFRDGRDVDCRGAKVALDGSGEHRGEGDFWVLDREGLEEEE